MLQLSTIEFFRELKSNNNKDWFDQNRKRYDLVKVDYLSLAGKLLDAMKQEDPSLEMQTAKDCIFRINRDVRFSKNKSPYKTNLGIALHPGGKKGNLAAYYLHIEEGQSFVGGGLWMPEASLLSKVRKEIHYFYNDLDQIINDEGFKQSYGTMDMDPSIKLIRPPKGYDISDPAIEYLKLKSFTAVAKIPDKWITSDQLIPTAIDYFKHLKPLIHFINRGLLSDPDGGI